jgi:hypothetical protein
MTVLTAAASELECEFAFGVVGQVFGPTVRRDGGELLTGAAAPASAIIGPDRRPEPADAAVRYSPPSAIPLRPLFPSVDRHLRRLSPNSLVLAGVGPPRRAIHLLPQRIRSISVRPASLPPAVLSVRSPSVRCPRILLIMKFPSRHAADTPTADRRRHELLLMNLPVRSI